MRTGNSKTKMLKIRLGTANDNWQLKNTLDSVSDCFPKSNPTVFDNIITYNS